MSADSAPSKASDTNRSDSSAHLLDRLRAVAIADPDRDAVVGRGCRPMSYAQLVNRLDALGDALVSMGAGPGVCVAVCLGASQAAAVAVFALLKIGATVVPIPLDQPMKRTCSMVQDTRPQLVIISAQQTEASASVTRAVHEVVHQAVVVELSTDGSRWETRGAPTQASPLLADDSPSLAYVMFTSGSTGRPKGVMVTADNLLAFLDAWTHVVGSPVGRGDQFAGDGAKWLWLTTLSFDPVIVEVVWTLTNGATLVVPEHTATGPDVAGAISEFKVTHLQCTPTRAALFLADPVERAALGTVSHMLVGGEVLSPALAQSLLDAGVARLTNIYGPTETTVWAFSFDVVCASVDASAGANWSAIALGLPTRGTIALVVDSNGVLVPPGTEGELWLGGADVSQGYIGNESLTAEVFVDPLTCHPSVLAAVTAPNGLLHLGFNSDPSVHRSAAPVSDGLLHLGFNSDPSVHRSAAPGGSSRLYKTGDLVRFDGGLYWFGGRRDGQVKIRGHRIETAAVEAAIESHGGVSRAAVVAAGEDGSPERRLVAFLTPSAGPADRMAQGIVHDVRAHSATLLAPAHLPTDWHVLPSLPLTATGKIDRRALLELAEPSGDSTDLAMSVPAHARFPGAAANDGVETLGVALPPVAQLTAHLSALFGDVIGKSVGPDEDFFAAGGDSVGAVELVARLAVRFGQRFPLRLLAEAGSPFLLADRLHTYEQGGDGVLVDFAGTNATVPALYLVHGAGGTVIGFAELSAALSPEVRLVGVQAIGTDGTHAPDLSVASMAQRYAAAIADRHRSDGGGPLQLGGYSDGGLIAVATAALLAERGFSMLPVVLLDAFLGTHVSTGAAGKLGDATRNLAEHPGRSAVSHLVGAWRGWRVRHTTLQRDHQLAERMAELGHRDLFDVVLRACAEARWQPAEGSTCSSAHQM